MDVACGVCSQDTRLPTAAATVIVIVFAVNSLKDMCVE